MPHQITFTSTLTTDDASPYDGRSSRLTLNVTAATGPLFIDRGVLVHTVDPATAVFRYSHVASPADLNRYRIDDPGTDTLVRLTTGDLWFTTESLASEALVSIRRYMVELCHDLDAIEQLGPGVAETVP